MRNSEQSTLGFVSALIVNWNTREHLKTCLDSLTDGALPDPGEIIIVDNNSSDNSAGMVAELFPQTKLICNKENVGFAKAVNQAASHARGDLLLFLNSDTILETKTIETCRDYIMANPEVGVLGCRVVYPDGRPQSSTFRFPSLRGILLTSLRLSQLFPNSWWLNWDRYGNKEWDEAQDVDVIMGSFLLLRCAALGDEAPLDEGYFMYGEETDMCRRLFSRGWRTVHLPTAQLMHVHGGSTKSPKLAGWATEAKARGNLRFLWKWKGPVTAYFANLLLLFGLVPRIVGWSFLDLMSGLQSGKLRPIKIHKGRALRFHLAVSIKPKMILLAWSGPNTDQPKKG